MMGLLIVILLIIILWYLFDFNLYLFGIITIINIFVLDLIQSDFVSDFDFKILPNKMGGYGGGDNSYRIKNHFVSDEFKLLPEYVQKMLLKDKFSLSHTIKEDFSFHPFSRTINDDSPRLKYTKPTPEIAYKPQVHWGQLKLMLSEVEFLTLVYKRYKEANDTRPIYIVYAGSAPGDHMPMLADMFPMMQFELYDPNEFKIKEIIPNINTYTDKAGWFTDEVAELWKDDSKYVCFISDIRTFPANNETIIENMTDQRRWWDIMNPELSMFKFRLPWTTEKTEYMEGDIYLQVYPPITSTETRLIVKKDAKLKIYDHKIYEEQCFYHNINRNKQFKNVLKLDLEIENKYLPHMDMCYDCTAFIYIVNEYIKYFDSENLSNERVIEKTLDIENNIWENKDLRTQKILQIHDMKGRLYSQFLKHCHNYNKCNICNYSNLKKQHVEDLDFNLKRKHGHETQNLN